MDVKMILTYVEYDANGELTHVAEVHTAEGAIPQPPHDASDEHKAEHAQLVADTIARKDAETRAQLQALADDGHRLLVLPAGTARPEHGRHFVDKGKLTRRTDAQLAAWQKAQDAQAARP